MMLQDHLRQLKQRIAVATPTGALDSYGKRTYGAADYPVAARVEPVTETQDQGAAGQLRVTRWLIITATAVTEFSRIWLPDDASGSPDATKARIPLRVIPRTGLDGAVAHYEVTV